ncbi:PREDICTED: uncharacterized protein LOC109181155 [Ipomoea nil]|uniref:uncharacterized protein LOC109181155 n=1 Tax=Ipomoea nil TaxID=35883 RepID=UPI000901B6F5|nr:PREDICTED: uncharacterized protein LOC109181155 [Ipomoea nil]
MAAASGQSREEDRAAAAAAAVAVPEAAAGFGCKYCEKRFRNKHALGGHQNAHRMERAMDWTVKRRRVGFMDYNPFYPFAAFPPLPVGGAGGEVNYLYQAADAMPPYFLPGLPEIPARPPLFAYPFPPAVPETQVLSGPAMTASGDNTSPVGSVPADSPVTNLLGSIAAINSIPGNTPEVLIEDGEVDLNLKL